MSRFDDTTVLITGGARGMGKLVARRSIARRAARVILWDIDEPALAATAGELRDLGGLIDTAVVDLADVGRRITDHVESHLRSVHAECLFDNFTRIDRGAIDGASEQLVKT